MRVGYYAHSSSSSTTVYGYAETAPGRNRYSGVHTGVKPTRVILNGPTELVTPKSPEPPGRGKKTASQHHPFGEKWPSKPLDAAAPTYHFLYT